MKYCQNCGHQYATNAFYCPKCGTASNQVHNNGQTFGNGKKEPLYNGQPLNQDSKYNAFAIASLILTFFFPLLGFIFSIVALCQIKKSKEKGKGLAIAALIISALPIVIVIFVFVLFFTYGWDEITEGFNSELTLSTACANVDSFGDYETTYVSEGEDGYIKCEDYECIYYVDGEKKSGTCDNSY